jgi:heme a synthase
MLVKSRLVLYWMVLGLVMIFLQITIGGVTRLTGSGLSITKWDIVMGTIPPLNTEAWEAAFELYKDTPQYKRINAGMSLGEFKFIYFWEYLHRLWARLMGFVFIIPFIIFLRKKWINPGIIRMLLTVVLLAGLVGVFGWIMVASGLIDRPWVNAYKLSIHLSLALVVYGYLFWTLLTAINPGVGLFKSGLYPAVRLFLVLLCIQIFLGGLMSGLKAALVYPTWPDLGGSWIPDVLLNEAAWSVDNFVDYESSPFLSALVQSLHRLIGYLLLINGLYIFYKLHDDKSQGLFKVLPWVLISLLIIQIVLGVTVLIQSIGSIPLLYGVLHQAVAILLLTVAIYLFYSYYHKTEVSSR